MHKYCLREGEDVAVPNNEHWKTAMFPFHPVFMECIFKFIGSIALCVPTPYWLSASLGTTGQCVNIY